MDINIGNLGKTVELPYFHHVRSWWRARDLPNVKLVHYRRLKDDLPGAMAEIAAFLGLDLSPNQMSQAVARCSFEDLWAKFCTAAPRPRRLSDRKALGATGLVMP